MIHWDDTPPKDAREMWSEWSMRAPRRKAKAAPKSPRRVNNFASAFVFALSAVVVSGLPQQLLI